MKTWQEDPRQAWIVSISVLAMLLLLWCVGAVAQGQVERAEVRNTQQLHSQAAMLRCSARTAHARPADCAGRTSGMDADTSVAVVYR